MARAKALWHCFPALHAACAALASRPQQPTPLLPSPLADYGVDGLFLGAAIIFFTYIGFDAISNTAEEVGRLPACCNVHSDGMTDLAECGAAHPFHQGCVRQLHCAEDVARPLMRALRLWTSHPRVPPALPAAPQARNVRHLPWAMVGTPVVSMAIYVMLALALAMITVPNEAAALPYDPTLPPGSPGQGLPFGPYGERPRCCRERTRHCMGRRSIGPAAQRRAARLGRGAAAHPS